MKPSPSRIVVLTGAGISAESGLRTFRGTDGIWENHRVEEVASPIAFARSPEVVHRFYNERRRTHEGKNGAPPVAPNRGHLTLAKVEHVFRGTFLLVTQNVDALHERAGSKNLLHMHGELLKVRCTATGRVYSWTRDCSESDVCDCCGLAGQLRPHIVWFGEVPMYMGEIEGALRHCDLFVAIGTSGHVYPAAGFTSLARHSGAHTVELNLAPSLNAHQFNEGHYGRGTEVIPEFFRDRLGISMG